MKKQLSCLVAFLFATALYAQQKPTFSALTQNTDAVTAGLGGTGLALTNNANMAIFKNPSTIIFSPNILGVHYSFNHIAAHHNMHALSAFYRIGRDGLKSLSFGFIHDKEKALENSKFRPYTWSFQGAYSQAITDKWSMAVTFKFLQRRKASYENNHQTGCFDFSATYNSFIDNLMDGYASWTLGFQAANIGPKLDREELPARVGVGATLNLPFNFFDSLKFTADANYFMPYKYRHLSIATGAEYNFWKYLSLRAGGHFSSKTKGLGNYATVGAGFNYTPISVDLAYTISSDSSPLQNSWLVTLRIGL